MRRRTLLSGIPALWLPATGMAQATANTTTFPTRPVRMVVPFGAGGITDLVARVVADGLQKRWGGTPVIVDNRPGAGSLIGTDYVAKSDPDGHTILLSGIPFSTFRALFKRLPFDPVRDFAPVSQIARIRYILYVNGNLPVRSLQEFIAYAKANPGKLNYGSIGPGGIMLAHELLLKTAGLRVVQVPYKGVVPPSALLTNEVQMYLSGTLYPQAEVAGGRVRALAVTGATRFPQLPDVPTFAEAGLPQFDASNWQCFFVRGGTSPALVNRIAQDIAAVAQQPEVRSRIMGAGCEVVTSTPEELTSWIAKETGTWEEVARIANVQPE